MCERFALGTLLPSALATTVSGGWGTGRTVRDGTSSANTRQRDSSEFCAVSSLEELRLVTRGSARGLCCAAEVSEHLPVTPPHGGVANVDPTGCNAMEGVWVYRRWQSRRSPVTPLGEYSLNGSCSCPKKNVFVHADAFVGGLDRGSHGFGQVGGDDGAAEARSMST